MAKSDSANSNSTSSNPQAVDLGLQEETLIAKAQKSPKNTVEGIPNRHNFRIPDYDLRVSNSNNTISFTAPALPVGGRASDAVFRELTGQRQDEYLTKIGNELVTNYNKWGSVTDVTMTGGASGAGVTVGLSGKYNFPPDQNAIKYAQGCFDLYRNIDFMKWAQEGIERGGVTYQVKDGQKIHYSVADLELVKEKASEAANRGFNSITANSGGTLPDNPREAVAMVDKFLQQKQATAAGPNLDDTTHPYNKQYAQALQGLEGISQSGNASKQDVAAALVKAGVDSGFNKDGPLAVVAGKQEGSVFAVQGEATNPASLRAKVDTGSVQPGSAQQLSEALTSTQAVAQSTDQTQQATKARVA